METSYNIKSPAVKRLMREAKELSSATEEYYAFPLEENLFEWHFTIRGQPGTEFDGGLYHGRILLPSTYPMQPPYIIFLTPNGRFEVNKKICLSISGHHPETWQPSWSIRTALLALIAFMPTSGKGTIGSLDYTEDERKLLAEKSSDWICSECGISNAQFGTDMNSTNKTDLTEPEDTSMMVNAIQEPILVPDQNEFAEHNNNLLSQFHLIIIAIIILIGALLYRRLSKLIEFQ
ncbi:ubiquitin-conjugating enzyme E2 J1-like [Ctenocephalides felis]|uniref:ubiquitin-conjugating enzyme E2 J1-like n=1 Tax=Ctenocephalides felis TaxID=7515 RepID=UPI000E6E14BA|nr:ubiquitin-conjugating enzyme E2 J1-like [Ctenocephalides felis]